MENSGGNYSGSPVEEENAMRAEATANHCPSGWTLKSSSFFCEGVGTGTRREHTALLSSSVARMGDGVDLRHQTSQITTAPGLVYTMPSSSSRVAVGNIWSTRHTTGSSCRFSPSVQVSTGSARRNGGRGSQSKCVGQYVLDGGLSCCTNSAHTCLPSAGCVVSDARASSPIQHGCMLCTRRRDELPITSSDALACCRSHLSAYEQEEILNFRDVYYCGGHTRGAPLASEVAGSLQCCRSPFFHDKEHNYRVVCGDHVAYRYELIDVIGQGTYGCVVRALDHAAQPTPEPCALKIARNIPCYAAALTREAHMLDFLRRSKQQAGMWVPQALAHFTFRWHNVLVLPLYGLDLKTLLRVNLFRPLPVALTPAITAQMVAALKTLSALGVTHADLKPDNIALVDRSPCDNALLLDIIRRMRQEELEGQVSARAPNARECSDRAFVNNSPSTGRTKTCSRNCISDFEEEEEDTVKDKCDDEVVTSHIAVIDFGCAHLGTSCVHPVQTVFYRAPEAALHLSYGPAVDMWSLGCIVYELITGVPLFQADSDSVLLQCHVNVLGAPSLETLRALQSLSVGSGNTGGDGDANHVHAFFKSLDGSTADESQSLHGRNLLQLLHINLGRKTTVTTEQGEHPPLKNGGGESAQLLLLDFLLGCLAWDPAERLTPDEASCHPYLAPYFRGETIGVQEEKLLLPSYSSMRCSGMYYLRKHFLRQGATDVLEAAEMECAHRASAAGVTLVSVRLDLRLAIRPLRQFITQRCDGIYETPLRVSAISQPPVGRASGEDCNGPRSYTTTFCDPLEGVEVSIMKFEDC